MSMAGRVVLVTGAATSLGAGLVRALIGAGASVALVGDGSGAGAEVSVPCDFASRAEVEDAFAAAGAALRGPADVVVHVGVDPRALEPCPIEAVDDEGWGAVWEGTMRAALFTCQAAFGQMRGRGGRIILVVPTLAMSGAAGLVPLAAAAEGVRLLAKSAARQWGPDGVTVNCVAVAPELVLGSTPGTRAPAPSAPPEVSLAPAAFGGPGDPEADLGPLVAFLAGDAAHFLTGATLCADGGVWLSP